MAKERLLITVSEKIKKRLKNHSEETGLSMSGIIGIALYNYLPDEKTVKEKPRSKQIIKQCQNVECAQPYDIIECGDKCPTCGLQRFME